MSESIATQMQPARWVLWTSRVLSAIPVLMLALSGVMKVLHAPQVVTGWRDQFGYPLWEMVPIGTVEILCAVIYAIPRTSVLGAILVTGYFGGAIATHVRVQDPAFVGALTL